MITVLKSLEIEIVRPLRNNRHMTATALLDPPSPQTDAAFNTLSAESDRAFSQHIRASTAQTQPARAEHLRLVENDVEADVEYEHEYEYEADAALAFRYTQPLEYQWEVAEAEIAKRNRLVALVAFTAVVLALCAYFQISIFSFPAAAEAPEGLYVKDSIHVVQLEAGDTYRSVAERIDALEPHAAAAALSNAFENSVLEPGSSMVIDTARLGIETAHWQP